MDGNNEFELSSTQNNESISNHQTNINQFSAYYPSQEHRVNIQDHFSKFKSHKLSQNVKRFFSSRKFLAPALATILVISAVMVIFMIPQDTEPIEGNWIKSDGQLLTFESDGEFSNQIYPGSTWSMDGQILSMYSTVQIIDEQTLVTKIIVQTVQVEFSDDELAMWWLWKSVTIDGLEESLEQGTCSLIIKESIADNTLEYALEAPNYQSIKPSSCQ